MYKLRLVRRDPWKSKLYAGFSCALDEHFDEEFKDQWVKIDYVGSPLQFDNKEAILKHINLELDKKNGIVQ